MDPREEARQYTGVWYDNRAKKFAAEVYSCGQRHFLGLFDTAAAAGAAYKEARASLPVADRRGGAPSFQSVYEAFLRDVPRDDEDEPVLGSELVYDDQTFTFTGLTFRRKGKGGPRYPLYIWSCRCKDCGAPYETMTAANASAAGITRRCELHRRGRGAKAKAVLPDAPSTLADAACALAERLSLAHESVYVFAFIDQCGAERGTDEARALMKFLRGDPASPVEQRGDRYFFKE
jgi:hypothetical protein